MTEIEEPTMVPQWIADLKKSMKERNNPKQTNYSK
jgi:hypothetical protein